MAGRFLYFDAFGGQRCKERDRNGGTTNRRKEKTGQRGAECAGKAEVGDI